MKYVYWLGILYFIRTHIAETFVLYLVIAALFYMVGVNKLIKWAIPVYLLLVLSLAIPI